MYCISCGKQLEEGVKFCAHCGAPQGGVPYGEAQHGTEQAENRPLEKELLNKTKGMAANLAEKMNVMSGGEGSVELRFKDFFSNVFVKHTQDEADEIFICGTASTTPRQEAISTEWPKPWLYSRVALVMGVTYLFLYFCCQVFRNMNAFPGLIVIGSFAVPVSLLIFFFEVNAPRNISFASVIAVFFIGGTASLVVTLFLFTLSPYFEDAYIDAILTGIIEELGKMIIVGICIKRNRQSHFILNGMLYGAAVGAGFAAFESAGYALRFGITSDGGFILSEVIHTIYLRAILSPGGHVAWAAITGAAFMIIKKDREFSWNLLKEKSFWMIFIWPIGMHAIWDMPVIGIYIGPIPIVHILLIAVAWIMIVVLLNRGLSQINHLQAAVENEGLATESSAPKKKRRKQKTA